MPNLFQSMSKILFGNNGSNSKSRTNNSLSRDDRGHQRYSDLKKGRQSRAILYGTQSMFNVSGDPAPTSLGLDEIKWNSLKSNNVKIIFGETSLRQMEYYKTKYKNIPRFVVDCIEIIERNYLDHEGLYRISGNVLAVATLKHSLTKNYDPLILESFDADVLASTLKSFFRDLDQALIPNSFSKLLMEERKQELLDFEIAESLRDALHEICQLNRSTLKFLIKHLARVTDHCSENRMTSYNLATVWGPTLVWVDKVDEIRQTVELVKFLIQNYQEIFKSDTKTQN